MTINLDELERLAREATPGPWEIVLDEAYCGGFGCTPDGCPGHLQKTGTQVDGPTVTVGEDFVWDDPDAYKEAAADAAYIAACSPDVVLALVERVRELEADMRDMQSDLREANE